MTTMKYIDENNDTLGLSSHWVEASDSFQEKQCYSWKELQAIELRRRSILKRAELSFWKILSFWDGTCLGVLSRDALLWASLAIYILIRVQVRLGFLPDYVANIGETSNIDIIGGFLSFLLVFFVNQSNNRFNEMFKQSSECTRRISDVAGLASTTLPQPNALRLVRYMNAAHVAGYVGLSHTYTKRTFFDELNRTLKLLTPSELEYIEKCNMDHRGDCFREIINWAMMEVKHAEDAQMVDGRLAGIIREKILSFRAAMDSIYDYTDQPIHFFYIHFLSLLTAIYLPIFAISNAYSAGVDRMNWAADLLCGIIVLLQAIFVIGLRLLGQKMLDAYGDDLEDLSVLHYVRQAWKSSNRMLSTQFPAPIVQDQEETNLREAATLGYPWDLRQRSRQATPSSSIV